MKIQIPISSFLIVFFFSLCHIAIAQKKKVWIDADSGNETDDIYAIARLLMEPAVEVVGVSSTHFNNADLMAFDKWNQYPTKGINTVQISQQLNEALLQVMGKITIPHPLGADRQTGRAWGGREARKSPAANGLIAAVKQLPKDEKLIVICLGALTNIASAIMLDTSIISRITIQLLGAKYDVGKGIWNKNEFNIRNDLNAFDYLLNNASANLVIMPVDVAHSYRFYRDSLYAFLRNAMPLEKMLKQRWQETNPNDTVRTLWDLALAEAFLHPELASISKVLTPPENTQRLIEVYSAINKQALKDDFLANLKAATRH